LTLYFTAKKLGG